ncbi:calcium-binding protein [Qipengyuania gelatinilytica]|uniref:Calcium-binding protein n=1 Tax=Qipengyuania gelatinilytica TaxID=2867231 RepID=A0ABX9A2U2_9SPHN|nr:calcium-binding protein [Qipengyuania gelatinilytica]QZD95595.1 hypothetical protein K3136_02375 [Qipengyuania gelatinilytica]
MYYLTTDSDYAGFEQVDLGGGSSGQNSLSRTSDGGFVSVAESDGNILVRIFDADGLQTGSEVLVASNGYDPEIVGLASGGFAVVWQASDASLNGIYLQVFNSAGVATSPVRAVNVQTFGNQSQPDIVQLADGNLAVAWTDNGDNGVGNIVYRLFASGGWSISGQVSVTSDDFAQSYYPRLAALNDGGFAISWTGPTEDWRSGGSSREVNVRIVDSEYQMQPVSFSSWDISEGPASHDAFFSSIAVLTSGDIIVTWTDSPYPNAFVYGQRLDASGSAIGDPFQIGSSDPETGQSSVVALADGGFVVTWRADTDDGGSNYFQRGEIYAQRYDAEATPVGDRIVVNQVSELGQDLPSVVEFGSGDLYFMFRDFNSPTSFASRTFYDVTNGTASSDLLTGTSGIDILRGLEGNDELVGGAGNDVLDGGAGFDIASYSNAGTGVHITLDTPSVVRDNSSGSVDTLISIEAVRGSAYDDQLHGSAEADTLLGDAGRDEIRGNSGSDAIEGGNGNDWLFGGAGWDEIRGGGWSDTIYGDNGNDRLFGDYGNDRLDGGGQNDFLDGGFGNDILNGSWGKDTMTGGAGADTFVFERADHTGRFFGNADLITDFSQSDGDVIDLSAIDAIAGTAGDDAFTFIGSDAFSGTAGELRFFRNGGDTFLAADVDGDGSADMFIQLNGDLTMTAADFVL